MKNFARFSLASVVLAALVGTAGCAGTAQSAAPAADSAQSTPLTSNKPSGFTEKVPVKGTLPADWQDGAGWRAVTTATEESVFAVGDYLAYIAGNEYENGPESRMTKPGHLILVDAKGSIVYTSKDQTDAVPTRNTLHKVSKDGATYLVFTEEATVKGKDDPNSLSKAPADTFQTTITVLDAKGKELYSKKFDKGFHVTSETGDAISSMGSGAKNLESVDVATGEASAVPVLAGFDWEGAVDGVNVYSVGGRSKTTMNMSSKTVTDGKWSMTYDLPYTDLGNPAFNKVGPFVRTIGGTVNPHTGEKVASLPSGNFYASSPDGNLLCFTKGVYSVKDKKTYPISEEVEFYPTSITNNGDVYGTSNSKTGFVNVLSGSAPKALPGVTLVPAVISESGLAAFSEVKGIKSTVFVTKK